jgi:hypothetical protein
MFLFLWQGEGRFVPGWYSNIILGSYICKFVSIRITIRTQDKFKEVTMQFASTKTETRVRTYDKFRKKVKYAICKY